MMPVRKQRSLGLELGLATVLVLLCSAALGWDAVPSFLRIGSARNVKSGCWIHAVFLAEYLLWQAWSSLRMRPSMRRMSLK